MSKDGLQLGRLQGLRIGGAQFHLGSGGILEIPPHVLRQLSDHRQVRTEDAEAGGVLLGRLLAGCSDVVVDRLTFPGFWDRRSRHFFRRSKRRTQQLINKAWKESGGTQVYLGEWHTHPEPAPAPSPMDRSSWSRIGKTARYDQQALVFIIAGQELMRVWELGRGHPGETELDRVHVSR